jgi:hypothetical protein
MIAFPLIVFALPANAQGTPAQRQACEQDYFRFCQHVGTEEAAARQCLIRNMRRLSPACRAAFRGRKR